MIILQLDPIIPLETPLGRGFAHFLLDYGPEFHLLWTVFLDETGESWTFPNPDIRLQQPNPSMGRSMKSKAGKMMSNASTGGLEAGAAKRDASPKGKKQPKDMGEKPTKMPMSMKKGKR